MAPMIRYRFISATLRDNDAQPNVQNHPWEYHDVIEVENPYRADGDYIASVQYFINGALREGCCVMMQIEEKEG